MEHIPVQKLLDGASYLFGVSPEFIIAKGRKARIFRARSAVALVARVAGYSYPQIGRALGDRDHKWGMHACDRAEQFYQECPEYKCRCDKLIAMARRWREASNDNECDSRAASVKSS